MHPFLFTHAIFGSPGRCQIDLPSEAKTWLLPHPVSPACRPPAGTRKSSDFRQGSMEPQFTAVSVPIMFDYRGKSMDLYISS
jgi:hypothetical protein